MFVILCGLCDTSYVAVVQPCTCNRAGCRAGRVCGCTCTFCTVQATCPCTKALQSKQSIVLRCLKDTLGCAGPRFTPAKRRTMRCVRVKGTCLSVLATKRQQLAIADRVTLRTCQVASRLLGRCWLCLTSRGHLACKSAWQLLCCFLLGRLSLCMSLEWLCAMERWWYVRAVQSTPYNSSKHDLLVK